MRIYSNKKLLRIYLNRDLIEKCIFKQEYIEIKLRNTYNYLYCTEDGRDTKREIYPRASLCGCNIGFYN